MPDPRAVRTRAGLLAQLHGLGSSLRHAGAEGPVSSPRKREPGFAAAQGGAVTAPSILGYVLMVAGLGGLAVTRSLFSASPVVIALQGVAVVLMVWARITFGARSFHAAANPTEGGLVTTGPYRLMRHPIYTSVVLFCFAGASAHVSLLAIGLASVVAVGALARLFLEERVLFARYPEYAAYAARTKRMVPYVF
jgi:protein-S-isoprenylcysteine O-methyltransferase Ste14